MTEQATTKSGKPLLNHGGNESPSARVESMIDDNAKVGDDLPSDKSEPSAVRQCAPCPYCDPELLARHPFAQGWSDDVDDDDACACCRHRMNGPIECVPVQPPSRIIPPLGPGDRPCKDCGAPAVSFGAFCAVCYGQWLHPEGLPLEPGDPADPFRAYNAEADAYILDQQMPESLKKPRPSASKRPCQSLPPFDDE